MDPTTEPIRDWRGTEITPGALVVYGAPVSRSIAMVEAFVDDENPFTKSGRVNLRVVRRAYGHGYLDAKPIVHVGADRLTVVGVLPPTAMPTEAEYHAEQRRERDEREAIRATHSMPERIRSLYATSYPPCTVCGATLAESGQRPCTEGAL